MKYLIIHISAEPEADTYKCSQRFILSSEHYQQIFSKKIVATLLSLATMRCGVCKSFAVPASTLFYLIHDPETLLNRSPLNDDWDEEDEDLHDALFSLLHVITEEISATDEEWNRYFETGLPNLAPLYVQRDGSVLIPEWVQNPIRLACEEVVFSFGTCEFCDKLYNLQSSCALSSAFSPHCGSTA